MKTKISFHKHNICFYCNEIDYSFQMTAVLFCIFTMLQEFESLILLSRLFQIFGNITFGSASIHFNFGTRTVSFTTLSDAIGLKISLKGIGSFSVKRLLTNSAV